ncbi:MAG: ABC transporter permease [Anaerolineaceae bacterium]|nr:ABC transporter permease [Anaerolineaceae bacterium]
MKTTFKIPAFLRLKNLQKTALSLWKRLSPPLIAVAAALIVCGVLMLVMNFNPLLAYQALFESAIGNKSAIGTTIIKSLPLLITGLAVTIAYRAEIFNIGVEGQILIGGIFAVWVGTKVTGLPPFIHIPLCMIAGMVGGMAYAWLPAWLKAKRGINEVIVTLLLNYMAALLLSWVVRGPLREPGQLYAKTAEVAQTARLPILVPEMRLHPGIFIALILVVLCYFFLWRTVPGFNIRFVGANQRAAEAAGINVPKTMLTSFLISGSLAGLAGTLHIIGTEYRMLESFLSGFGYDAIAAALVGQLHPFGVLLGGFFFGALRSGSNGMQISLGIPSTLIYVIQALIILFVLASYHIRFGWRWWKREKQMDVFKKEIQPGN